MWEEWVLGKCEAQQGLDLDAKFSLEPLKGLHTWGRSSVQRPHLLICQIPNLSLSVGGHQSEQQLGYWCYRGHEDPIQGLPEDIQALRGLLQTVLLSTPEQNRAPPFLFLPRVAQVHGQVG